MRWILRVFLLNFMLMFSLNSFAERGYVSVNPIANEDNLSVVESKCATVSYQGTDVVDPQNFSICENDISFGILNMIFQKVFLENEILSSFSEGDGGKDKISYAYNIGGPIIAIIEAVTWLTFSISSIIIFFVTIKTLNISANSGQFMGDWNTVYVITRTVGTMILIFPIGSFSLAQVIILIIALFAIMGGNFLWGAFLSMQQAQSITMESLGGSQMSLSISQAESLVKSNTCALRSAAASTEINQNNVESTLLFDVSTKDHISRLSSCSRNNFFVGTDQTFFSYGGSMEFGSNGRIVAPGNAFPLSTIAFGSPTSCSSGYDVFNKYDERLYGKNYQCGNIVFNTADLEAFTDGDADVQNEGWFTGTKQDVVNTVQEITNSNNPNSLYKSISTKAQKKSLTGRVFVASDYESEVTSLTSDLVRAGSSLYETIKENINTKSPNPPAAYQGTYVALSAAFSNFMGGDYDRDGYNSFWKKLMSASIDLSSQEIKVNRAINVNPDEEEELMLSPMYIDAKLAAAYLLSAHCSRIWSTYYSKYDSTLRYMEKLEENKDEDIKDEMQKGSISSECIVPLIKNTSDDALIEIFKALPDVTDDVNSFYLSIADIDNKGYRDLLINLSDGDSDPTSVDVAIKQLESGSTKKASAIIDGMAAYNYVIRTAFENAIKEIFVNKTDTDFLINMRDLGWSSAGGFILSIAKNGSELSKYNQLIQSQVSWSSSNSNEKYINSNVLMNSSSSFNYSSMSAVTSKVFSDLISNTDYENLKEVDVYTMNFSSIFKFIEDLLTAPLSHLKAVGGFDQNKTLREGAQDCYENGNCSITSVHPVTALVNVGNDLIDLCFNLIILKTITGSLSYLSSSAGTKMSGKASGKSKKASSSPMLSIVGTALMSNPVTRTILKIADVVDPLLGIITSMLVPPLFIVGIFFSFIVPLMPFLAFLMGFIGWIMLILELLIAVNLWVLLMGTPDKNGKSRADVRAILGFVGQLLFKPSLMVIALIFGWNLSAISVYFLNMTIFGALSPTETGSFIGLLDLFMFYIVYLIVIFIAIKHSFKIMDTLPDKIASLVGMSGSGDVKAESLGTERLIQVVAGEKVMSLAAIPSNIIDRKKDEAKRKLEYYKDSQNKTNINQAKQETERMNQDISPQKNVKRKEDKSDGKINKATNRKINKDGSDV